MPFELLRRVVTFLVGLAAALVGVHFVARGLGWLPSTLGAPLTLSLEGLSPTARVVAGGVLVAVGLGVAVLGIHVRAHAPTFELSVETLQPGGVVSVSRGALRDLITRVACGVEGITSCRVRRLRLRQRRWLVQCEVAVRRQAHLKDAATAVRVALAAELEQQTGLPVGTLDVFSTFASITSPVLRVLPGAAHRRVS